MTPDEFMANIRYFGQMEIPEGASHDTIFGVYISNLERYSSDVIQRACDTMLGTRKHRNFPLPEECTRYCREAQEEIATKAGVSSGRRLTKEDPAWSKARIIEANRMMNSNIGRLAATEGWIVHLHDFCRENSRLPNERESERVRRDGLAIKAEREEMARLGGATNRIVLAVGKAMEAKRKRLSVLAYRRDEG